VTQLLGQDESGNRFLVPRHAQVHQAARQVASVARASGAVLATSARDAQLAMRLQAGTDPAHASCVQAARRPQRSKVRPITDQPSVNLMNVFAGWRLQCAHHVHHCIKHVTAQSIVRNLMRRFYMSMTHMIEELACDASRLNMITGYALS
jgi:hypothetical protein